MLQANKLRFTNYISMCITFKVINIVITGLTFFSCTVLQHMSGGRDFTATLRRSLQSPPEAASAKSAHRVALVTDTAFADTRQHEHHLTYLHRHLTHLPRTAICRAKCGPSNVRLKAGVLPGASGTAAILLMPSQVPLPSSRQSPHRQPCRHLHCHHS